VRPSFGARRVGTPQGEQRVSALMLIAARQLRPGHDRYAVPIRKGVFSLWSHRGRQGFFERRVIMDVKMKNIGVGSKLMTVKEVSEYLRIHPSTVYRQLKRGGFPAFKIGSDWRFNVESIDRWRLGQGKLGN
jgi:excisionase family DNA binding protein